MKKETKQILWRLTKLLTSPIWIPVFVAGALLILLIFTGYDVCIHMPITYVRYGKARGFFNLG